MAKTLAVTREMYRAIKALPADGQIEFTLHAAPRGTCEVICHSGSKPIKCNIRNANGRKATPDGSNHSAQYILTKR